MWRKLRIILLLFVLATVVQQAWLQGRDRKWNDSLYVAVYPINVDGSARVASYLAMLTQEQFEPVTEYFAEEAGRFGLTVRRPFEIRLGSPVAGLPPALPTERSALQTIWWSLHFRWWAWRNSPEMRVPPKIRLYLLYHDPARVKVLSHSTALSKGRIGLVNVFGDAGYAAQNNVVIAHELLHTVGATDKYDLATNQPQFPDGFAEPGKEPRYPQEFAELMAGRVPVSEARAEMPADLSQTLIGEATAREIQWLGKH